MKKHENIYTKITELLGREPESCRILEEQINMNLQMEYFEFSRTLNHSEDYTDLAEKRALLYNPETSESVKKEIIARLAFSEKIEAYRILEEFVQHACKDLQDWAILAMQECRMLIESRLLDENQIFISTGLGGKGFKLRYFIALLLNGKKRMTTFRQRIIKNETEDTFSQYKIDAESIRYGSRFVTMLVMIPLNVTIRTVFENIINSCNLYGNFLEGNFIVTNVRILTDKEIRKITKDRNLAFE